jgi:hypothetical protein
MILTNNLQNEKLKNRRTEKLFFCFFVFLFFCLATSYAQEITILYTGQTRASLYPCHCPYAPDGGVARRASLVKKIRRQNPYTLVLDAGRFFAGGKKDIYKQGEELDRQRTLINLNALQIIRYDALGITEEEFNFGAGFLKKQAQELSLPLVSANISSEGAKANWFKHYIIKEIAGLKIGITGLTPFLSEVPDVLIDEPLESLKLRLSELKKEGADIIILLSSLAQRQTFNLVKNLDIDIIILATDRKSQAQAYEKKGRFIILRPYWQGKRLGRLDISVKAGKIVDTKFQEIRLSDKIKDDPDIVAILPACFRDTDCRKKGLLGFCENPASLKAKCRYRKPNPVSLLIIEPRDCWVCDTQRVQKNLERVFAGLKARRVYYPSDRAEKLLEKLGDIDSLPVYLLYPAQVEKEKGFAKIRNRFKKVADFYLLKSQFAGMSYFIKRRKIPQKFDLFVSLFDAGTDKLLKAAKSFNPDIHFLAIAKSDGSFEARNGLFEIEEDLRCLCVKKYYPQKFWDYISCRAANIRSSWWQDCAEGMDTSVIKACAQSQEAEGLLKKNISLNRELKIMFGPTYLLNNYLIFSTEGVPSKEELGKILNKEK